MGDLERALTQPPRTYRPLVAYALNARLEADALRERVDWFHQIGYGGLMIMAWPGLPNAFMDDDWLASVGHVLDRAAELELEAWIWDDWTFPSGFGGGLVTREPRYRARRLHLAHDVLLEPGEEITLTAPQRLVAAGVVPVNKYAYYAPAGPCRPLDVVPGDRLTHRAGADRERLLVVSWEYTSFHQVSVTGNDPSDPTVCTVDMLNPAATRRFTEVVHQRYLTAVGRHVGRTLKGFFYDEPELPYAYPWTDGFLDAFQARKGYDLRQGLPLMLAYLPIAYMGMGGYAGCVDDIHAVANDYYDVWTDLAAEGFYGVLKDWCHDHELLSIGHQDLDNKMNTLATVSGHFFKNSARNDHPGVDVIWKHVEPGRWLDFPRYAGSAARVLGKARAMSETLAEMGHGMHADAQRFVLEQQIVRNVTQFFLMASAYDGQAPGYEEPPDLSPGNPILDAFGPALHQRIGRVAALMNLGQTGCQVGLYLPMYDINRAQHQLAHPHARNNHPCPGRRWPRSPSILPICRASSTISGTTPSAPCSRGRAVWWRPGATPTPSSWCRHAAPCDQISSSGWRPLPPLAAPCSCTRSRCQPLSYTLRCALCPRSLTLTCRVRSGSTGAADASPWRCARMARGAFTCC